MKKKYLIAIVAVILCVCVGIGIYQGTSKTAGSNGGAGAAKASQSQTKNPDDDPIEFADNGGTELTDDPDDPDAKMGNVGNNKSGKKYKNAGKHTQKGVAAHKNGKKKTTKATTTTTTTKRGTLPADRLNKKGLKKRYTTKKHKTTKSTTTTTTKKTTATTKKTTTTTKKTLSVSIEINCNNAVNAGMDIDPIILKKKTITVDNGDTVYVALKKACYDNNIPLKYKKEGNSVYVTSIGGLAEKDCGDQSGWMYTVNGKSVAKGCNAVVLKAGDSIEWYYVTSPSDRP